MKIVKRPATFANLGFELHMKDNPELVAYLHQRLGINIFPVDAPVCLDKAGNEVELVTRRFDHSISNDDLEAKVKEVGEEDAYMEYIFAPLADELAMQNFPNKDLYIWMIFTRGPILAGKDPYLGFTIRMSK